MAGDVFVAGRYPGTLSAITVDGIGNLVSIIGAKNTTIPRINSHMLKESDSIALGEFFFE